MWYKIRRDGLRMRGALFVCLFGGRTPLRTCMGLSRMIFAHRDWLPSGEAHE